MALEKRRKISKRPCLWSHLEDVAGFEIELRDPNIEIVETPPVSVFGKRGDPFLRGERTIMSETERWLESVRTSGIVIRNDGPVPIPNLGRHACIRTMTVVAHGDPDTLAIYSRRDRISVCVLPFDICDPAGARGSSFDWTLIQRTRSGIRASPCLVWNSRARAPIRARPDRTAPRTLTFRFVASVFNRACALINLEDRSGS